MYILLNDKKIDILSEQHDPNSLVFFIAESYSMNNLYNNFADSDLSTITVFNENDSVIGVYSGYNVIESFFYTPIDKQYTIVLNKKSTSDVLLDLKNLSDRVDTLTEDVVIVKNGDLAKQTNYALSVTALSFDEGQAVKCPLLYPEWSGDGVNYTFDKFKYVRFSGKLYKLLQEHTSQLNRAPDVSPSLFVEVSDPEIEFPDWKQPINAETAYSLGAKVTHNGKKYISKIDNNTTEPGTDERWWKEV